ncbi:MAG: DVUA0089 family protein [Planctomycetota bacterium]
MKRALVLVLAMSAVAMAQVWVEQGDAPDLLPGQACVGAGPLTAITGVHTPNDVDLYQIAITNPAGFSASTVGGTTMDSIMALFDSAGNGVIYNDDEPYGTSLQSTLDNSGGWITSAGTYYLAVWQYSGYPNSPTGRIWNASPYNVIRPPDGPGAPGPLTGWTYAGTTQADYRIALAGVSYVPEPAALALLGLGLLLRRR